MRIVVVRIRVAAVAVVARFRLDCRQKPLLGIHSCKPRRSAPHEVILPHETRRFVRVRGEDRRLGLGRLRPHAGMELKLARICARACRHAL